MFTVREARPAQCVQRGQTLLAREARQRSLVEENEEDGKSGAHHAAKKKLVCDTRLDWSGGHEGRGIRAYRSGGSERRRQRASICWYLGGK